MVVVYFDKRMGALHLHAVHWLKSSCLEFNHLFSYQIGKKDKVQKRKKNTKRGLPGFRCYSLCLLITFNCYDTLANMSLNPNF